MGSHEILVELILEKKKKDLIHPTPTPQIKVLS